MAVETTTFATAFEADLERVEGKLVELKFAVAELYGDDLEPDPAA